MAAMAARLVTPAVRRLGAPEAAPAESQALAPLGWALRDGDRGGAATPLNAPAPEPHDHRLRLTELVDLDPPQPVPGLDAVAPEQRLAQESEAARLSVCSTPPARGSGRRRLRRPLLLRTRAFTKQINRSQSKRHMHD
jgi:hypothetical protein